MEFRKGLTYLVSEAKNNSSKDKTKKRSHKRIKLLPVHNIVLFPHMTFPLKLQDKKAIELVKKSYKTEEHLGLIALKKNSTNPSHKDLHTIGTIAKILKIIHLAEHQVVAILQGKERFTLDTNHTSNKPYTSIKILPNQPLNLNQKHTQVLIKSIKEKAFELLSHVPDIPSEVHITLDDIKNPDFLVYYIAASLINFPNTQQILNLSSGQKRATLLLKYLLKSLEYLKIQKKIYKQVHSDIKLEQRKVYLKQQIKVLQQELGEDDPNLDEELQILRNKAKKINLPTPIAEHLQKTLKKTARLHPSSAEYANFINYAHTLIEIPWNAYTQQNIHLPQAEKILNQNHYGMQKVKERILTHLAVQKLKKNQQGRILCFHGPPGVGKTSLCKSIAEALNRKYARISLGGLYDAAELYGHRKTYVGAMMGQIMQAIKTAGSSNPVIVLDEIDKIDNTRGNPSAALLEILDPAQNHHFTDYFLGVPFDLSKVIFIATANDTYNLPSALKDRLEIIKVAGYPTEEKIAITKQYLLPTARKKNGLQGKDIILPLPTLQYLIEHYTNESGVRELGRKLDTLCSQTAKDIVLQKKHPKKIQVKNLVQRLGPPLFTKDTYQKIHQPGVSIGLAWTPTGGEILFIEAILYKGEGKVITSGQLGEIMEESAITALSYLKAHAQKLAIDEKIFKKNDLHIHFPDGATPKDGPSAGIAILTAITSLYTQRKVKEKWAMTGEITLRGNVLPVGGIKEKILAARRAHIENIILSTQNKKDVEEINPQYINDLTFHYVDHLEEVLNLALKPNNKEKLLPKITIINT